jgi:hypothetical protein
MTAGRSEEDDYHYQPVGSEETGGKVRVRSQENRGIKVVKVDTPRVGTDGLREALKARYGVKRH